MQELRYRYASLTYDCMCASCGPTDLPLKDTYLGMVCSDCRKLCAYCEDWLLGDVVVVDGHDMHQHCAADLEALTDALMQELMPKQGEMVIMAHYNDELGGAA